MKTTFLILQFLLVITILGCVSSQTKGGGTFEPAPSWVQEKAQNYLENMLGKDYISKYISFEKAISQTDPKKYVAYFEYKFPYQGYKRFEVIAYNENDCCSDNGPAKPHLFKISEEEALDIATKQGMKRYDGVSFVHKNKIVVEHKPPNPVSKNWMDINGGYGDYILEVYVNERKKDEISNVYIDSDTGELLGFYISPDDYKPRDNVSVPQVSLPSNYDENQK